MLYDNDDYLNGLDHSAHKDELFSYPYIRDDGYVSDFFEGDFRPTFLGCDDCRIILAGPLNDSGYTPNPYLPEHSIYHSVEAEISKIWYIAKRECNITEKLDLYPNNDCLNERFGRGDEPAGSDKCREYYFWGLEVKSRACMIKNAKLEELNQYEICGQYDDAFLCTKDSIVYKQKLIEEAELKHQQEEDAKKGQKLKKKKQEKFYTPMKLF